MGEPQCAAYAARFIRNGTWFTPTIAVFDSWLGAQKEYLRYWLTVPVPSPLDPELTQRMVEYGKQLVGAARRAGMPLLAGSDAAPEVVATVQRELVPLAEAGLTPLEALQAATLNPAKYLNGTDSLGGVASGKLADLVLLDADPLADIRNTAKVRAVVANGRYFDRAALDAMLAAVEQEAKSRQGEAAESQQSEEE